MQTLASLYPLDKLAASPDIAAAFLAAANKKEVAAAPAQLVARKGLGGDYPLFAETWRLLSSADPSLGFASLQGRLITVRDLLVHVRRPTTSRLHPALQAAATQDHQIRKLLEVAAYFANTPSHPVADLHLGPVWLLSGVQMQFLTVDQLSVELTPPNSPMFFASGLSWPQPPCSSYNQTWPQALTNTWKGFARKKLVDVLPSPQGSTALEVDPTLPNLYALGSSTDLASLAVFKQMDPDTWERWLQLAITAASQHPLTHTSKAAERRLTLEMTNAAYALAAV